MISNLQPLYDFSIIEENKYSYTTDSGVIYTAYFIVENTGFNIYSFGFEKTESKKYTPDRKIKHTILHIICLFFEKNENAIMYVCDSCDGRELARKKLFSQWFNEYNHSTLIIKELNVSTSFYNLLRL